MVYLDGEEQPEAQRLSFPCFSCDLAGYASFASLGVGGEASFSPLVGLLSTGAFYAGC